MTAPMLSPTEAIPPIMVTSVTTAMVPMMQPTINISPAPEKEKRGRRGRKNAVDIVGTKQKKSLLLDELGDALVDQMYTTPAALTKLHDRLDISSTSVVDHLRNNFTTELTASSCASSRSGSSRTLTGVESHGTPPTSLDERDAHEIATSTASTVAPTVSSHHRPSMESLRTSPSSHSKTTPGTAGAVFCLEDFSTMSAIQRLTAQYGRVANMGILDHSYRFFVNQSRTGALSFKVRNQVAIVGGDPLCEPHMIPSLLAEFATYRRKHHWGLAFMGASGSFVRDFARPQGWTTIRFGTERVLNPQTNEVLLERSGKRIAVQNRQLLNSAKGGVTLGVYAPAVHGTDAQLQSELVGIYDAWRAERNTSAGPQAFITVYDPFALPALMTFVYSRGPDGTINGFAALRRLGDGGYHIDPCIAAPGAAKGISDLLIVSAMALLHRAGVSYLGFGFEPVHVLAREDITGMAGPLASLTKEMYGHTFRRLPIHGKKAYHDKFRPDVEQDCGLYLVFPGGMPGPRQFLGMIHMANISLRKILWADLRAFMSRRKRRHKGEKTRVDGEGDPQSQSREQS
ncbi:uncharacterized protein N7496_012456 [Penicillium cataractarum]|uniref:Phosphatidylglycerol lysyltransferase C-terminal domain-containing protein n=1 Tax=Penicillium cataractarum TaxID=2100454 RepID=A0A9W9R9M8_9EURO|nr:uncharacterized protein N7496_012456 [Penicillium cataractarum]KAJ5355244.1 hypothetical protein N7496_012456 [Penicillium cataractarum]